MIDKTDAELADRLAWLREEAGARKWQETAPDFWPFRIWWKFENWLGLSRHRYWRSIPLDWPNGLAVLEVMAEIERRRRWRTGFRPDRPTRRAELQLAHLAPPARFTRSSG